ncbi:MAG: hypothetical protein RSD57_19910 [Comamonas sp.]
MLGWRTTTQQWQSLEVNAARACFTGREDFVPPTAHKAARNEWIKALLMRRAERLLWTKHSTCCQTPTALEAPTRGGKVNLEEN